MGIAASAAPAFEEGNRAGMSGWLIVSVVSFAIIFAINSSIHSFLVVNYAKMDKVAVSVGFYYMSNALGRLFGTLGSGILYTYVGEDQGELAGSDAVAGFAACFFAGTACSLLAAVITMWIDDDKAGLKCGSCWEIVPEKVAEEEEDAKTINEEDEEGRRKELLATITMEVDC